MIVTGRVQGVGFRAFARDAARALGVHGWVRNAPDGSVEIEASGGADAMAAFARRVRAGPPWARVAAVREEARAVAGPLPDPFTVLR
jgi:acylphosphatase